MKEHRTAAREVVRSTTHRQLWLADVVHYLVFRAQNLPCFADFVNRFPPTRFRREVSRSFYISLSSSPRLCLTQLLNQLHARKNYIAQEQDATQNPARKFKDNTERTTETRSVRNAQGCFPKAQDATTRECGQRQQASQHRPPLPAHDAEANHHEQCCRGKRADCKDRACFACDEDPKPSCRRR